LHPLHSQVERVMREVAATIIMPRFRSLRGHEVEEKSPGEIVIIADRESEARLTEELLAIMPDSRVLGEEAQAADPASCSDPGRGAVWIVDPLDGTSNFADGHGPFAIMIALAIDGEAEAAWILDPQTGRLCSAVRGRGAAIDGKPIQASASGALLLLAAVAMNFLPEDRRLDIARRANGVFELVPIPRCAGEQYPHVVLGQNDIALFERTLPWDHVAGCLLLTEAGGVAARPDGSAYRVDQPGSGLLVTATQQLWDQASEVLFR
jgi:fructose-1,6-bisphosphatase/inositol monophosphatase family enzyme